MISQSELTFVRQRIRWAHRAIAPEQNDEPVAEVRKGRQRDPISIDFRDVRQRHQVMNRNFFVVQGREVNRKRGKVPVHPSTLQQTPWVRACRDLPESERVWIRYAYIENTESWQAIVHLAAYVWSAVEPELTEGMSDERREKIKHLVTLGIYHVRHQTRTGKKLYTADDLGDLIGGGNWRRDYAPYWRQINGLLRGLDQQAITRLLSWHDSRQHRREYA